MDRYWQPVAAILSGIGFLLSALWHLEARTGAQITIPDGTVPLHLVALVVGICVVWIPTAFYLRRFNGRVGSSRRGFEVWKSMFAGAPKWLLGLTAATLIYAVVNFILVVSAGSDGFDSGNVLFEVALTGHAMVLYAFAAVIHWAAVVRQVAGFNWKCSRGHTLLPSDPLCPECGAPNPIRGKRDRAW